MTDAVFISDVQGRFIDFNDAFATFHRFRNKDECAKTFAEYPVVLDVFMPDGKLAPLDMWAVPRALRGETVTNAEYTLRRKDTGETWIGSYSFAPIRDAGGAVVGSVVVGRDITEIKRAEEELEKLASVVRHSHEFMSIATLDGKMIFINEAGAEMVGLSADEVARTHILQVVPDHLRNKVENEVLPTIKNKGSWEGELQYRNLRTGRLIDVYAMTFAIKDPNKGMPLFLANTSIDITDRKRAEEELRRSRDELDTRVQERTAELAKANERLRDLSSKLLSAHEEERKRIAGEIHDTLGSCLSGIKFKVENVLLQAGKGANVTTEPLGAIIPVIQEGIEECRRMQMDLRPPILDDLGLLATLSWFCRRFETIFSTIHIEQEIGVEEAEIPNALKIVIYRVIQEATNNIAKHSKASLVRLSLRKLDKTVELVIIDNGQGFNLQRAGSRESTFRGLGLTSMKERAELSGGTFTIQSAQGQGTVIRASWPALPKS